MTLVDSFAPPLPLQAMLVVRKTTDKKKLTVSQPTLLCRGKERHNYTLIIFGWSHNLCEGLSEI